MSFAESAVKSQSINLMSFDKF